MVPRDDPVAPWQEIEGIDSADKRTDTAFGQTHRSFVSLGGETVNIQGGGLYGHESVSMASQGVGMDLVTLLVAMPLLLLTSYFAARGSLRGRLLRVGAVSAGLGIRDDPAPAAERAVRCRLRDRRGRLDRPVRPSHDLAR